MTFVMVICIINLFLWGALGICNISGVFKNNEKEWKIQYATTWAIVMLNILGDLILLEVIK